jgi:hypothetical protein
MFIPKKALLVLLPLFIQADAQASGSGRTTRYWDCCKPSCGWTGKLALASGSHPVSTCDANDNPLTNYDAKSGCDGGGAYMCTNQMPWAASDSLAYGFGAVSIAGGNEASWCCACYELTFTSGPVSGKKMIIQATNTGGDLGSNHFDLAVSSSSPVRRHSVSDKIRCPVVDSVSSTAVRNSGELPRQGGAHNMEAYHLAHNAIILHPSSRQAATGVLTGSRMPIIQLFPSGKLHAPQPSRPDPGVSDLARLQPEATYQLMYPLPQSSGLPPL